MTEYFRFCTICNNKMFYKNRSSYRHAKNNACYGCRRKVKDGSLKEDFIKLTSEGKTVSEISDELKISIQRLRKLITRFSLSFNRVRFVPEETEDGNILCRECGESFKKNSASRTKCGICTRSTTNKNLTIEGFLHRRLWKIKDKCLKNLIPFDLTYEYLTEEYTKQEGKCFYTGVVLETSLGSGNSRNQLSFDRIDPSKGYIVGNVVLCTFKINSIKQDITLVEMREWMPGWYDRIIKKFPELEIKNETQ